MARKRRTSLARRAHRTGRWMVGMVLLAAAALGVWIMAERRPQDLPFTLLDLGEPVGMFTGRKLTGLGDDPTQCRALLDKAGVRYDVRAPQGEDQCRVEMPLRPKSGRDAGSREIALSPADVAPSCPVVAALVMWEWQVVQPAAQRHFGEKVTGIRHLGSYNCRRMYGRGTGDWSEHARANALDVAGFTLADGRTVSVLKDWDGQGEEAGRKAAFLREVRDGACDVFSTVLSPGYNAAHADHFHLDQADRGAMGWRACR